MIKNFAIIISNTSRSVEYLRYLKRYNFSPKYIIYLDDMSKNKARNSLKKENFFFPEIILKKFKSTDINQIISNYIFSKKVKNIIYSGYPGVIVKNLKLLKSKNLIHNHPGKLPQYKGSTTIFYSLLNEKKIFCSTIILNEKIDSGKVLCINNYPVPRNIKDIDRKYDDKIRSLNMIRFLKNKDQIKKIKKSNKKKLPYYVMHPLLRLIVFKLNAKNI